MWTEHFTQSYFIKLHLRGNPRNGMETSRGHFFSKWANSSAHFLRVNSRGQKCPREFLFLSEFSWTYFGWILVELPYLLQKFYKDWLTFFNLFLKNYLLITKDYPRTQINPQNTIAIIYIWYVKLVCFTILLLQIGLLNYKRKSPKLIQKILQSIYLDKLRY